MQSPGKLLSTLSVALLVLTTVVSADTPSTVTSSASLRSNADALPVLKKDTTAVAKHAKLDDERLLAAYYGKVILHPYLHHLSKNPPHPEPPRLSRSRHLAQKTLLELGGVREDQPFEEWITRFIQSDEETQTPVFQNWFANQLSSKRLAKLLKDAGKSHHHYPGTKRVVATYRRFRNALIARGKAL